MAGANSYGQPVLSPRAVGLGAYGASVKDTRDFVANPSGLVGMRDWDIAASTYLPASSGVDGGFVFGGISVGKRFLEDHALAAQYTPGALLEFVLPSTLSINGVGIAADRKISYSEPAAVGYAYRFSGRFSAGVQGRLRTETVTDPQYQFVDTTIVAATSESRRDSWLFDAGLTWQPMAGLTVAAVGRNLTSTTSGTLPADFQSYTLPLERSLELTAAYDFSPAFRLTAGAGTDGYGAAGGEWAPGLGLAFRTSTYLSTKESSTLYALGASAGWAVGPLELDAAFLHFTDQEGRKGTTPSAGFDVSSIHNITMNSFTTDRLLLSAKVILGNVRESLARIVGVEIVKAVYPSAYQSLAYRPIGKVRVRNVSDRTVEARASFYIDRLMDAPTESPAVVIAPHDEADIPLTAVFNESVRSISTVTVREGNVYVSATPAGGYDDRSQTKVLIHGKNDWDGDVHSLRYFVTPDDSEVIRYSREILLAHKDSLSNVPQELQLFQKAAILCEAFAGKLLYINDPKQSADYVQYPAETLLIRGGDCDDMTVCFSSLLNSVGIGTALVDVVPPGRLRSPSANGPQDGHIYLMFDTGLAPRFASHIAENPKRYVLRKSKTGAETVWIPVESTVITKGFAAAWTEGAREYFDDVEVGLGLVKGWVNIVDVY
jgi:hypothetical protein